MLMPYKLESLDLTCECAIFSYFCSTGKLNIFSIPQSGLVKGILLVKEGIDCIQIPDSMIKAPPSEVSNDDRVFLIFKTAFAPSKNSALLERYLDPVKKTTNSFITKPHKELCKMYQRILTGLGVSKQLCDDYVKQSRDVSGLKHKHLMGVADPTGQIPYGEVFVPGCE